MSTTQITLDGDKADSGRERPETFMWCDETEQWILRSLRHEWPHELYDSPDAAEKAKRASSGPPEDDEDEPEQVGKMYTVELVYERRFTVKLPAVDENNAKRRAKELHREGESRASGGHHIHTDVTSGKAIYEDDDEVEDLPGWPW